MPIADHLRSVNLCKVSETVRYSKRTALEAGARALRDDREAVLTAE